MKKYFVPAVSVACLFLSFSLLFAADTWAPKNDFYSVRADAVGFAIASRGYVGLGADTSTIWKDFWEYEPVGGTWTQKADFAGTARYAAVGFAIGGKGYVGTGFDGSSRLKDFWEYDPVANAWTQKADFGGTARYGASGFAIGNRGYLGTGYDGTFCIDFWEYNPDADSWLRKANLVLGTIIPYGRVYAVGFAIGSKGYMGLGFRQGFFSFTYQDFWEYDPAADAWTLKASLPEGSRYNAVGFAIGNKGYVGLGYQNLGTPVYYQDFWEYDPEANAWTRKTDFGGVARWAAVGFSISNKGYVGAGDSGSALLKDFWEYDSGLNTVPDAFAFTDVADADLSTSYESNPVTVSGISAPAFISITGGEYAVDSGSYTSADGIVENGQTVKVRLTSSANYATTKDATLYIGGVSDAFSVTTKAAPADLIPEPFAFVDQTGVELNTLVESNSITVEGITAPTPITITGGEYAVDGGAYTSADGTVQNGQTVTVRVMSSGSYSATKNATLTIGGVSDTFSVTTKSFSSGGGCFIATAAFGTPMAQQVEILRKFRDRYLLSHEWGRQFVAWYYRNGPAAASFIKDKPLLRAAVRLALYPIIGFCYLLLAGDLTPAVLLFLLVGLLALHFRFEKIKIS